MFEVRIHGRGGQGVVTAAELLAAAAFLDGRYAQAFPSFGSERMGAPVTAFVRIDDREIRLREPVVKPGALIILDSTLLHQVDVFRGLAADSSLLINTSRPVESLGIESILGRHVQESIVSVPATELAMRHIGRPVPNAAMLGAFVALTGRLRLKSVLAAIRQKLPGPSGEANAAAAGAAHDAVVKRAGQPGQEVR
jgi:pyruvate ferredoxin oxidoreductase gamma subunit